MLLATAEAAAEAAAKAAECVLCFYLCDGCSNHENFLF
tara:strand:+ start:10842 stop:10955 length:114 start_codon:yes stop_codon:yes gene_type:complete